jgi:multicomponent Na+:H+ antiporter subunit G
MINSLSYFLIGVGIVFWFWGTWPLVGNRSVLFKLHSLSVADTLGSMAIIVGLLLKIPREWPLLVLAIISLAIWNTVLGYVLAYCSSSRENDQGSPSNLLSQDKFEISGEGLGGNHGR